MLAELTLRNFGLFSFLNLSLDTGYNVITGETGAGKSMLVEGLQLLVGGRASLDYVRHGKEKAEIEGLFVLPPHHPALTMAEELGIELSDNSLILSREISIKGKNVCRINGRLVPLTTLKEVGQTLLHVQGQHEQHDLLAEENHLAILDRYAGEEMEMEKSQYLALYEQLQKVKRSLADLEKNEQERAQRLDFLQYQFQEITSSHLEIGEDERLEKERRIRANAQKLAQGMEEAIQALYGDGGAYDSLAMALTHLEMCATVDESLGAVHEQLQSLAYQMEDLVDQLHKYRDRIDFDPEELNRIESRLVQIEQLKRKYGATVQEILAYGEKIRAELEQLELHGERKEQLIAEKEKIVAQLLEMAAKLSQRRKKTARQLVEAIQKELAHLYMQETKMEIQFSPLTSGLEQISWKDGTRWLGREGWEELKWLISTNPGEPPKPLAKIASGGELARLLLALKTVVAKTEPVTTMVFDEIDTGVSGRVAQAMAEKLYTIALDRQVIVITHQPQVAAMADHHFLIRKTSSSTDTQTSVSLLDDDERQIEIARMMSGKQLTKSGKEHVQELLGEAEKIKAQLRNETAARF